MCAKISAWQKRIAFRLFSVVGNATENDLSAKTAALKNAKSSLLSILLVFSRFSMLRLSILSEVNKK